MEHCGPYLNDAFDDNCYYCRAFALKLLLFLLTSLWFYEAKDTFLNINFVDNKLTNTLQQNQCPEASQYLAV